MVFARNFKEKLNYYAGEMFYTYLGTIAIHSYTENI